MKGTSTMSAPQGAQGNIKLSMDFAGTVAVDTATGIPQSGTGSGTSTTNFGGMNVVQKTTSSFAIK
jgi:hypothetical protein